MRIAKLGQAGGGEGLIEWVAAAADQTQSARETVIDGLKRWVAEYGVPTLPSAPAPGVKTR